MFLDVSEDEDDEDYQISEPDSSSLDTETHDDDTFPSEGSLDEEEKENLEIDSDNSNSDEDEYQPLSMAEQEEVHGDIAYLEAGRLAAPNSDEDSASPIYKGNDSMAEYKSEMDQANSIILAAVNNLISTLSSTLYALSIHWTKEFSSGYLSIPDFIPSPSTFHALPNYTSVSTSVQTRTTPLATHTPSLCFMALGGITTRSLKD